MTGAAPGRAVAEAADEPLLMPVTADEPLVMPVAAEEPAAVHG
ncbi:hypothetical protein ACF1G0_03510 [Streptomyces sp. NPDC013953]